MRDAVKKALGGIPTQNHVPTKEEVAELIKKTVKNIDEKLERIKRAREEERKGKARAMELIKKAEAFVLVTLDSESPDQEGMHVVSITHSQRHLSRISDGITEWLKQALMRVIQEGKHGKA